MTLMLNRPVLNIYRTQGRTLIYNRPQCWVTLDGRAWHYFTKGHSAELLWTEQQDT